ncbi:Lanosterol synthase (Oxidosqualene--lanosterol cyclase) [Mycoemilia scoparia]|uniref:Lanosterol synthase (Oxidosqualene--lanosterol cyclase) n=1 Tax=Mycoemilia scoparia TaxID=417184 RepID=A0A9W7ZLV4_9FUNG|nr:Lanosterol synthase (Oxidosqualene--lanosterol cyclase) [Mycoemilia scoparia]
MAPLVPPETMSPPPISQTSTIENHTVASAVTDDNLAANDSGCCGDDINNSTTKLLKTYNPTDSVPNIKLGLAKNYILTESTSSGGRGGGGGGSYNYQHYSLSKLSNPVKIDQITDDLSSIMSSSYPSSTHSIESTLTSGHVNTTATTTINGEATPDSKYNRSRSDTESGSSPTPTPNNSIKFPSLNQINTTASHYEQTQSGPKRCIIYLEPRHSSPLYRSLTAFFSAVTRVFGPSEAQQYHPHCSMTGYIPINDCDVVDQTTGGGVSLKSGEIVAAILRELDKGIRNDLVAAVDDGDLAKIVDEIKLVEIRSRSYFQPTTTTANKNDIDDNIVKREIMNVNPEAENYQTDLTRWRLLCERGRQIWKYYEPKPTSTNGSSGSASTALTDLGERPQSFIEKYWLGLPTSAPTSPPPKSTKQAAIKGFEFYKHLQDPDSGHWPGLYDGPMFITCGLGIAAYITGIEYDQYEKNEYIRYLFNRADPEDGGWGLHFEGKSSVFGTAMNYVFLRTLGVLPDHPNMIKARNTLHELGGATGISSWGKFWLSVLGVYEWEGLNPLPPELWLLPEALPIMPGNWWVHSRVVFMAMSQLYGTRRTFPLNELTQSLRKELYVQPYDTIDWSSQGDNVSDADRYVENTFLLKTLNKTLRGYERLHSSYLRKKALSENLLQIHLELDNTNYLCIAPVNFAINLVVAYYEDGPDSKYFQGMKDRMRDVVFMSPIGLTGCGTNGSQLWDTAFCVQACVDTGLADMDEYKTYMQNALKFLDETQIRHNPRDYQRCYRHQSKGAWPFSTYDQGYTVSDTTAEGLKAVLKIQAVDGIKPVIPEKYLCDSVDLLIGMQNPDDGFASYELIRGPKLMEHLNTAAIFKDIMIEYSYVECTTSVVLGLTEFRKSYPDYRANDIQETIDRALMFIKRIQRPDGGWVGSWGICFTYASQFALQALASVGQYYENSETARKGCDFLISKQNEDGGWGESYHSCEISEYVDHPDGSQVVNTAFALLSLMAAKYPDRKPIDKGIKLIMERQQPNGEWLQEGIEGVFNKYCMIAYPNFKFIFTIWALGKYAKIYGESEAPQ